MRYRRGRSALALLLIAACHGRAPIASCDDDVGGVYLDPSGRPWMVLDDHASLEAYPLFDDFREADGLEIAPRAIDLVRPGLDGDVRRRYARPAQTGVAAATCVGRAPAHVASCSDDRLEITLADPPPPLSWQPCSAPPGLVHTERWLRN